MMKKATTALLTLALLASPVVPGVAMAQDAESSCGLVATAKIEGVPADRANVPLNLKRLIAGYGRAAKKENCKIAIACVAVSGTEAAYDDALETCVAVRDTLVQTGFVKADISTSRQRPGGGRAAGVVYFSTL